MKTVFNQEILDLDGKAIQRGEEGKTWWIADVLIHSLQTHGAANKDACYRAFDAAGRLHKQRRSRALELDDDDYRIIKEVMGKPSTTPLLYAPAMRAFEDAKESEAPKEPCSTPETSSP